MKKSDNKKANGISRRDFLAKSAAAGTALPLLSSPLTAGGGAGPTAPGNFLVVIYLEGGNDLLNTTVPVQLQAYYDRRPGLNIQPQDALAITGGPVGTSAYKLHPALPALKSLYESGKVAFVQRVGYPDPNLSHFESLDIWSRGWRHTPPSNRPGSGWVARYRDTVADAMGVVGLGVSNRLDFAGGAKATVALGDLASFQVKTDYHHQANSYHRLAIARKLLVGAQQSGDAQMVRDARLLTADLVQQIEDALDNYSSSITYPNSLLGKRLHDTAVLLQAGFPLRMVYTARAGFDTHADQGLLIGTHPKLLGEIDGALDAFVGDLKAMGMWDRAVIALVTEFGRRNEQNGNGSDHGEGGQAILLGGRVKGGFYGGAIDQQAVLAKNLVYTVDFRTIYKELLAQHLDTDPAPIFPEPLEKNTTLNFLA